MQIDGKDFIVWIHEQRKKEKNFFNKPKTYLKELESQTTHQLKMQGYSLQSENLKKRHHILRHTSAL